MKPLNKVCNHFSRRKKAATIRGKPANLEVEANSLLSSSPPDTGKSNYGSSVPSSGKSGKSGSAIYQRPSATNTNTSPNTSNSISNSIPPLVKTVSQPNSLKFQTPPPAPPPTSLVIPAPLSVTPPPSSPSHTPTNRPTSVQIAPNTVPNYNQQFAPKPSSGMKSPRGQASSPSTQDTSKTVCARCKLKICGEMKTVDNKLYHTNCPPLKTWSKPKN